MWWDNKIFLFLLILYVLFCLSSIIIGAVYYAFWMQNIRKNNYVYKDYDFSTPKEDFCYGLKRIMDDIIFTNK